MEVSLGAAERSGRGVGGWGRAPRAAVPGTPSARRPWPRAGEGGVLEALSTARTRLGRRER
ncbi:hypothetical protein MDA_GLEAN10018175 [Myotis davidii]|uniref:Uncharacterized protein n=1 Tax=Myotis davidii TaxID=225400 RepID=L5LG39_MYODS|nr:hypothetical protein MDA_GLEAN10018175 [Myotis davidii]